MLQDNELYSKLGWYHSCTGMYKDKLSVLPFESLNDFAPHAESFLDFIAL